MIFKDVIKKTKNKINKDFEMLFVYRDYVTNNIVFEFLFDDKKEKRIEIIQFKRFKENIEVTKNLLKDILKTTNEKTISLFNYQNIFGGNKSYIEFYKENVHSITINNHTFDDMFFSMIFTENYGFEEYLLGKEKSKNLNLAKGLEYENISFLHCKDFITENNNKFLGKKEIEEESKTMCYNFLHFADILLESVVKKKQLNPVGMTKYLHSPNFVWKEISKENSKNSEKLKKYFEDISVKRNSKDWVSLKENIDFFSLKTLFEVLPQNNILINK